MPFHSGDRGAVAAAADAVAAAASAEEYLGLSLIVSQNEASFTGLDYYQVFDPEWSSAIIDEDTEIAQLNAATYVTSLSDIPDGGMGVGRLLIEDNYEENVYLLHTVGVTDPIITSSTVTYDDDEETELTVRFGSNIGGYQTDLDELVEDFVSSAVQDIATTALKPQFSFKKVKYKRLDYDHLSSFEESEGAQATGASLAQTEGSGEGTSY